MSMNLPSLLSKEIKKMYLNVYLFFIKENFEKTGVSKLSKKNSEIGNF